VATRERVHPLVGRAECVEEGEGGRSLEQLVVPLHDEEDGARHERGVVFEPLADFRNVTRASRAAEIEAAVIRYAGLLEQYCRSDPYNWFNFFDFWSSAPRSVHPA